MDTSVEVPYTVGSTYDSPRRVNNLGLMSMQQNLIMFSGIMIFAGLLMIIFTKNKPQSKIEHKYKEFEEKAKKAEYKGNKEDAIDNYMDALYHLETDYKLLHKSAEDSKRKKINEIKIKVSQLKGETINLEISDNEISKDFYILDKEKRHEKTIILIFIIIAIGIILSFLTTNLRYK
ncbi:hypothetical protein GCM10027035_17840 [Emticicia sediminis]